MIELLAIKLSQLMIISDDESKAFIRDCESYMRLIDVNKIKLRAWDIRHGI